MPPPAGIVGGAKNENGPCQFRNQSRLLFYRVVTDEELIGDLSFPVYRRVATMIFVPVKSGSASTVEMVTIDPQDLQAVQELDLNHGA